MSLILIFCLAVTLFSCISAYLLLTDQDFTERRTIVYAVMDNIDRRALKRPALYKKRRVYQE